EREDAERIEIAPPIEGVAHDLLWAHELRRTESDAGSRESGYAHFLAYYRRQAEIQHDGSKATRDPVVGDKHDVFRFEVAVEDVLPIGVLEAPGDLDEKRNPLLDRQWTGAHFAVGQWLTFEIRHH